MKRKKHKKEPYPLEDRALKEAARFMVKELLPLLGVEGTVRRAGPTEAVFLEVKNFLADFVYEMADGTWKRLEFESDRITMEHLRRFRACEAVNSYQYQVEVSTYVLCTSNVKKPKSSLIETMNTYHVSVVRMKDCNVDWLMEEVERKQGAGQRPGGRGTAKGFADAVYGWRTESDSQGKEKFRCPVKGTGADSKAGNDIDEVGAVYAGNEISAWR